ncbi:MAG: hypothetical protein B6245_01455 [Desulfobacteraceae bacterium 4572_88]|nr:MAG: hypothetical protein B6245_01455 [Desulfobacteraceae bacterium 4572_88]
MKKIIRIGISACLTGRKVRYDGGHKRDSFLTDVLGKYVEYVQVCPEVEFGLGIPRESIRLEGEPENPRLVGIHTQKDISSDMREWAEKRVRELEKESLSGFIFKKKSPSCGVRQVKVHTKQRGVVKTGMGIFARVFSEHFPLMPTEEEDRLSDPEYRKHFVKSILHFNIQ